MFILPSASTKCPIQHLSLSSLSLTLEKLSELLVKHSGNILFYILFITAEAGYFPHVHWQQKIVILKQSKLFS